MKGAKQNHNRIISSTQMSEEKEVGSQRNITNFEGSF